MPFDRLIRMVDQWATKHKEIRCFAQIGRGGWRPRHMEWVELLPPPAFRTKLNDASLIVAHAGMGTILSALDIGKKLIVIPRHGYLHETRNDHQMATAKRLKTMGLVTYATDEVELTVLLADLNTIKPHQSTSRFASPQLLKALRGFILEP